MFWVGYAAGRLKFVAMGYAVGFAVLAKGPVGIALAWVVSSWILAIPALWYAGRPAGLGAGTLVMAVWKYVLASALAGGSAALIIRRIPSLTTASGWVGAMDRSVTVSVLFAALYLGAVILLHGGCEPLRQIATLARDVLPRPLSMSTSLAPAPVLPDTGLQPFSQV